MIAIINAQYILIPLFLVYLATTIYKIKKNGDKLNKFQYITLITFGIYILSVIDLTQFPINLDWSIYRDLTPWYKKINPIPILTIDMSSFILNVIMLFPYGVYQYLLIKEEKLRWEYVALKSFIFSLCIELTQLFMYIIFNSARSVDVNDLVANTLGGVIGYVFVKLIARNEYFREVINQFKVSKSGIDAFKLLSKNKNVNV